MKKIKISLIYSVFFIFSLTVHAQNPRGNNQAQMPMDGKVTGIIQDGSNNQPVEYASVALYKMKDSTLVTGVISNTNGLFSIENTPYGKFYIEVTFVGFKKQRFKNILVNSSQKTANIGTLKIESTSTSIKEVEVIGTQAAVQYRIDKKIIDVSQNAVAAGGTVVDALQNAPSIQTDIQGNVTVRGSSNFTVLIDGKPSVMTGSEALQQIPASLVQNVEIITNPSAKYDAEGSAGIINVVMKKQKIHGMNGAISLTAGTGDKYNGNINMSYKNDKFNYIFGADLADMRFSNSSYQKSIKTVIDTAARPKLDYTKTEIQNGQGNFRRKGFGLKAGVEYTINDNNSLTLSGNGGQRSFERPSSASYIDSFTNNFHAPFNVLNSNTGINKRTFYNIILDYQLKLGDKGHQLSANAFYSKGPENNNSTLVQDTTDTNWVSLGKNKYNDNTTQTGDESDLRSKVDYALPLWENGKLEAGYQGRYQQTIGDQTLNGLLVDKINFTDQFQELYTTISNTSKIVDFMIGLRGSYEKRSFEQKILGQTSRIDKLNWFPTVHLTRQLPWNLQIQASYSRRISRPRDWNLDPLPVKTSATTIRQGNPNLKPELSDSYELNFQKKINDASFFSAEGFYRRTTNLIQNRTISPITSNLDLNTFVNVNHDQSIGVEFMLNLTLVKWFNFNASSSIYDYRMYSDTIEKPQTSTEINKTKTWNLRINPSFRLTTGTSIQLNYQYNGPTKTLQGTRDGNYSSSIGIRQDILKRKGSLTLNVRGLFGQEKYSSTSFSNNTIFYNSNKREVRVYLLTFTYRINNYKVRQNKQSSDDTNTNGGDQDMGQGGM